MERTPRNLVELSTVLKCIDERPGLASYNYCGLLDIHETTFYRNIKTLRAFGLLHPTKFKLNPKAELAPEPVVVKGGVIDTMLKSIGSSGAFEDFVIAVAKRGGPNDIERKKVNDAFANAKPLKINTMLGLFAMLTLTQGNEEVYKDKKPFNTEPVELDAIINKLIEELS
jgi:hypothetical protein